MLKKLIAGDAARKTRFHDERGNVVPLSRAIRNGPRALVTGIARLSVNARQVRPWISYDAQEVIARHLNARSRVLEFGSGMSTVWYAQHAGEVISIENYRPWYDQVTRIIESRKVANITYRFAEQPDDYSTVRPEERGDGFDLIMNDGMVRDLCARRTLDMVRPGGIIYLDNSDKGPDAFTGNVPDARRTLLEFAEQRGASVRIFTDFAPTQLFVQQGLMITLPSH